MSPASRPGSPDILTTSPQDESTVRDGRSRPPPSRRRDKPQLSCDACRRRKVRCDRLQPCRTCVDRGLGSVCVYPSAVPVPSRPRHSVQQRMRELEDMVTNLMQRQQQAMPANNAAAAAASLCSPDHQPEVPGSLKRTAEGVNYHEGGHWTEILDSIAELRDHFDAESFMTGTSDSMSQDTNTHQPSQTPLLVSGCCKPATKAEILASVPERATVDRLVSRFLNIPDLSAGLVHKRQFLDQYDEFWRDPSHSSLIWIGLLFGIMACMATYAEWQAFMPAGTQGSLCPTPEANTFRERCVQCLSLGGYTHGGPYVIEALLAYLGCEIIRHSDANFGVCLVRGVIVQIAMKMGLHRDPRHFPNLTPFEGEMRRRLWAVVWVVDLAISFQLGLPSITAVNQMDTAEPRNIEDSEFGENSLELPPSHPESQLTPILHIIGKIRITTVWRAVREFSADPRPRSVEEIATMDRAIQDLRDNGIPPSLRWISLAQCIGSDTFMILQRIYFEACLLRLEILTHHRRGGVRSDANQSSSDPRGTENCIGSSKAVAAATKLLELQRLLHEEMKIGGLLYHHRFRTGSLIRHDFLLATSVLCTRLHRRGEPLPSDEVETIRRILSASLEIWRCVQGNDARKAMKVLEIVLAPKKQAEVGQLPLITEPMQLFQLYLPFEIDNLPELNFLPTFDEILNTDLSLPMDNPESTTRSAGS